jgi:glycosyltransferase involved in cell wall biosynthesis
MSLRIGVLGGVPPALGGGGLEVQIERTAAALAARGHTIVRVESAPAGARWDVLHAFGAEGGVQFALEHWTRGRTPLVISPVLVVSPGVTEIALRAASRLRRPATYAAQRVRTLERADALVAITGYEAGLLRDLTRGRVAVDVVPNGIDRVAPGPAEDGAVGAALLLGRVSARKRQREVLEALAHDGPVVVAGAAPGDAAERAAWEATVARTGARWLGEVRDPARVARLQADAAALVHFSSAEVQSLAVLETLAQGTPVVLSDIPSHRELAAAHPLHVRLARRAEDLAGQLAELRAHPPAGPAPAIPSWDDVAARLEAVYSRLA